MRHIFLCLLLVIFMIAGCTPTSVTEQEPSMEDERLAALNTTVPSDALADDMVMHDNSTNTSGALVIDTTPASDANLSANTTFEQTTTNTTFSSPSSYYPSQGSSGGGSSSNDDLDQGEADIDEPEEPPQEADLAASSPTEPFIADEWDIPSDTDASWLSARPEGWKEQMPDDAAIVAQAMELDSQFATHDFANDINPIETYMRHLGEYTNCRYPCPRYELKADARVYTGGPNFSVNIVGMTEFNGGEDFAILWDNANMAFYKEDAITQYGDDTGSHYYYIRAMPGEPRGIAEVSDSFPGPIAYAARTIILFYNYDGTLAVNASGDPYFINVPQDVIDITYDGERDRLIVNLDRSTDECWAIDNDGSLITRVSQYCNKEYEIRYLNFQEGIQDIFNRELLFNVVNDQGQIFSEESAYTFLIELVNRSGTTYGAFYTLNHMASAPGMGFYSYPKYRDNNNLIFLDYLDRGFSLRALSVFADFPAPNGTVVNPVRFSFNTSAQFTTIAECRLIVDNATLVNITNVTYGGNSVVASIPLGNHSWYVTCRDVLDRMASTQIRNLSVIEANITPPPVQMMLSLHEGWNLISLPLSFEDASVTSVLASIDGKYDVVQSETQEWKETLPPPVRLQSLTHTSGYWIEMSEAGQLLVNGTSPDNCSIPLHEGWNLVGYLGNESQPVASALASIAGKYDVVQSETQEWKETLPPPVRLQTMSPGQGYWINMLEAGVLDYPGDVCS